MEHRVAEVRRKANVEVTLAAENRWEGSKNGFTGIISEVLHRIMGWDEGAVKVGRVVKHLEVEKINRP